MSGDERMTVTSSPREIAIRLVLEDEEDPEDAEEEDGPAYHGEADLSGDCHDALFRPCSPVFAPPPPGRERATLPRD